MRSRVLALEAVGIAAESGIESGLARDEHGVGMPVVDAVRGHVCDAGVTVGVANNGGNNSIDVNLSTGTPKALLWQGYVNNVWDTSTANWLDLNTGLHTNFATLDKVAFDDTG